MRRAWTLLFTSCLAGGLLAQSAPPPTGDALIAAYPREIRPILESRCFKCHGPQKKKGDVDFSRLKDGKTVLAQRRMWKKALFQVEEHEMPPEAEKPLSPEQRATLLAWLRGAAAYVDCAHPEEQDPGPPVLRRLNRTEYNATLRDLTGVTFDVASEAGLPEEATGTAFDTSANALVLPPALMEKYFAAADLVLDRMKPPKGASPRETVKAFARRAYRRPVADDELDRLMKLHERETALRLPLKAVLVSPHFLFRIEREKPGSKPYALSGPELATRLSYFLWSTMPDAELLRLASQGQLRAQLPAQVKRMLADPRAAQLARNFTGQWLQARDVEGIASNPREIAIRDAGEEGKLKQLFAAWKAQDEKTAHQIAQEIDQLVKSKPDLEKSTRAAMRNETEAYFGYVVREDRPITELIDSNYTFLNEELARYYGIPGVVGKEMRKVTLPAGSPRGGVLTQGSALLVTSNPDRTSPVKRGLFVLANFLGTPPPPPPANVPALEASESEFHGKEPALRDVLRVHRENPLCSSCHNRMDPIGLAFENFNGVGQWRDSERKQPIEAQGSLITGETFNSVSELKRILVTTHREDFYRTLTAKLMTYAIGRGPEYYDIETIDRIVRSLDHDGGRFSTLLMGVIESAPFQKMRTQAAMTVSN
jgi:mono/diheme cytochrome c family protein